MTSPFKKSPIGPGGRLFPHSLDRFVSRLPHDQRFEVIWPAPLGPWTRGDVLERHVDLIGAHLQTLLKVGALKPTAKPAYKAPQTIANLKARAPLTARNGAALVNAASDAGLSVNAGALRSATMPVAGVPSTRTTVVMPADSK